MGSGSAGNGGISDADPGFAYLPSLAFLANGTAIVAWESVPPIPGNHMRPDSAYNSQIYARRYVSCYQLTLTHFGEGGDPVASPSNSPDCPTGSYTYSQLISLSASPASPIKPGFGYQVYGWQDTDDDASTANANTLTMPASNHTVTVTYGPINSFIPLINYRCFEGPEEFEPNNNIGQANGPLCGGNTIIKGWPNDEYDYFKIFSIHEGTISAVVNDHYGGGPQISLFYESVSEKNLKDVDTEAKDGLEINYEDARPGIYYLVIYTEAPDPGETTPYTLHVVIP